MLPRARVWVKAWAPGKSLGPTAPRKSSAFTVLLSLWAVLVRAQHSQTGLDGPEDRWGPGLGESGRRRVGAGNLT